MKNLNWKSVLAILSILALGYVMGILTSGRITQDRIKRIHKMRTAEGFQDHFFSKLEATDEQKELWKPFLNQFSQEMETISKETTEKRKPVLDSLEKAISPGLQAHQTEKFQEILKRMQRSHKSGKHGSEKNEKKSG